MPDAARIMHVCVSVCRAEVGVPVVSCVALSGSTKQPSGFRKPSTGMWTWLEQTVAAAAARNTTSNTSSSNNSGGGSGGVLDKGGSFFVGDAAGRAGDHSRVDLEFAAGAGPRFYTESEFFGRGVNGGEVLLPPDLSIHLVQ